MLVNGISLLLVLAFVLVGALAAYFGTQMLSSKDGEHRDVPGAITLIAIGLLLGGGACHHVILAVIA